MCPDGAQSDGQPQRDPRSFYMWSTSCVSLCIPVPKNISRTNTSQIMVCTFQAV